MDMHYHHSYTNFNNRENHYPVYRILDNSISILNYIGNTCNLEMRNVIVKDSKYLNMSPNPDKKYIEESIAKKDDLLKKLKIILNEDKITLNITDDELKMINTAFLAKIPQEIFFDYDKIIEKLCELKICNFDIKVEEKTESYALMNCFGGQTYNIKYITINMYNIFGTKYSIFNSHPSQIGHNYSGSIPNPYPGWTKMIIYPENIKPYNKYDVIVNICKKFNHKIKHIDYMHLFFNKMYDSTKIFDIAFLIKNNFVIKNDIMFILSYSHKIKIPENIINLNIMEALDFDNLPLSIEYLNIVYLNNCHLNNLPISLKKICFYGEIVFNDKKDRKKINIDEIKIPFNCKVEVI